MPSVESPNPDRIERPDRGILRQVGIPVPAIVRRALEPGPRGAAAIALNTTARVLVVVIPTALAVGGLALALVGAAIAEFADADALGTLGLEVGAAMWFAGAVTLGARPSPTALRVGLLAVTGLAGLALIAAAFVGGWSGVGLDLAMEFGVGAVAVVVLDVLILGVLQARLDQYGTTPSPGAPSTN
jgi:hypothetical protein